jgi:hypothetical protein
VEHGQAAARRRRCSPFRLTSAHQPVGHGWPYWALSGTAVAVGQSLEGSTDGSTARTRLGVCPAAGQIGSEPMRTQPSAASPSEPVGRPAVASGQVRASHGVTATLRLYRHEGWNPALRFGAGFGGYSSDAGNKPQPSAGPSPRPALTEVARQPVRPVLPLHSAFGMRSSPRQRLRGLPASVSYGTASAHRHPARVWHPKRH